jgi:hypothetical protein
MPAFVPQSRDYGGSPMDTTDGFAVANRPRSRRMLALPF